MAPLSPPSSSRPSVRTSRVASASSRRSSWARGQPLGSSAPARCRRKSTAMCIDPGSNSPRHDVRGPARGRRWRVLCGASESVSCSIRNDRRAPRIPLRVWATISLDGQEWRVETEDVGPGGCLVRSERALLAGASVRITIPVAVLPDPLDIPGKVAWSLPPRAGIAFEVGLLQRQNSPGKWFKSLLAAVPRLQRFATHPAAEVDLDAPLFLGTLPRLLDLSPEEAQLVGNAEQGILARDLFSRAGVRRRRAQQTLFALLDKHVFTLNAAEAGDPWAWRTALVAAGHSVCRVPPSEERTRPAGSPHVRQVVSGGPASPPRGGTVSQEVNAPSAGLLRGTTSGQRSPEAQALFAQALAAEAAGHIHEALQLLRRGLALAPRDREMAAALGRFAFRHPAR